MPIYDKQFPATSRHLPTGGRSWDEAVYQTGKPILDSEQILSQEINQELSSIVSQKETPSGFLSGSAWHPLQQDFVFPTPASPAFVSDGFYMLKQSVKIGPMPLVIEYSNTLTAGTNVIQLDAAPLNGGAPPDVKRTDFVFLEAFRALVSTSPRATAAVQVDVPGDIVAGDDITIDGTPLTAFSGAPGVDQFDISSGTAAGIAQAIADAVNDPLNSFVNICTAQVNPVGGDLVVLRASDSNAGSAGNVLTLSVTLTNAGSILISGATFAGGADTGNKPSQTKIYRNGNVDSPLGVAFDDDIADPVVMVETTKRVQNQYRIRATGQTEAVNFQQENGFDNSLVYAWGTNSVPFSSPVTRGYSFLPADGESVLAHIEVTAFPLTAGDTITINGIELVGVGGARTPGSDNFNATLGSLAALATEIAAAINDGANSFATEVLATPSGAFVGLTRVGASNISLSSSSSPSTDIDTKVTSAVSYGLVDPGLWIAGDGSATSSESLGVIDGFVYGTPIGMVFRRNNASGTGGFDPLSNTNGALSESHAGFNNTHLPNAPVAIPAGESDRPDNNFHDAIVSYDFLDLRRHVAPSGFNLSEELKRQMALLLDGSMATWAIDGSDKQTLGGGSGDVGTKFLVCDEIGRSTSKGGIPTSSGDTNRGSLVANFDHIRRRFADWPVVERRIFPIAPDSYFAANNGLFVTKATALKTTWQEGDTITIDLDALNGTGLGDWSPTPGGGWAGAAQVSNWWPSTAVISDVLRVVHDDGNFNALINQNVAVDQVRGLGSNSIEIVLGSNSLPASGGLNVANYALVGDDSGDANSPRRIFVELEITYGPAGVVSDTPDLPLAGGSSVAYPSGPLIVVDDAERPDDFEAILPPAFRTGYREIALEYQANDGSGPASGVPITEQFVSNSPLNITLSRRINASTTPVVTDVPAASAVTVDSSTEYGSSSRLLVLDGTTPLSGGGQTLVEVEYYAQDPLPNWGTAGFQVAVYYRSNAPQTLGVQAGGVGSFPLPDPLTVRPVAMSPTLWTGGTSSGSVDLPYPYTNPSDQIAVNEDAAFNGEWDLVATSQVSVGDFDADTGLLNLHQMVVVDPNSEVVFEDLGEDGEFRAHYKITDSNSYRPTAMAQPLSGPSTHKVYFPFLAVASEDSVLYRKNEVLLVVVSRFAILDSDNVVRFTDVDNRTCAAIYRTMGLLLLSE